MDLMQVQVIVANTVTTPSLPFYGSGTVFNVSAADRLTVSYDGNKTMNYYVNGVEIHTVDLTTLTLPYPTPITQMYGAVTLYNNSGTVKQCGVVDYQMGTFMVGNVPGLIIGGSKRKTQSNKKITKGTPKRRIAITPLKKR